MCWTLWVLSLKVRTDRNTTSGGRSTHPLDEDDDSARDVPGPQRHKPLREDGNIHGRQNGDPVAHEQRGGNDGEQQQHLQHRTEQRARLHDRTEVVPTPQFGEPAHDHGRRQADEHDPRGGRERRQSGGEEQPRDGEAGPHRETDAALLVDERQLAGGIECVRGGGGKRSGRRGGARTGPHAPKRTAFRTAVAARPAAPAWPSADQQSGRRRRRRRPASCR